MTDSVKIKEVVYNLAQPAKYAKLRTDEGEEIFYWVEHEGSQKWISTKSGQMFDELPKLPEEA